MTGVVAYWNEISGYGFIAPDAGGTDIFVHRSYITLDEAYPSLEPGQRVEYIESSGRDGRGPMAKNVRVLPEP